MNWKQGEDVIIAGSVSNDDAKKIYPGGWKAAEALHPHRAAAEGLGSHRGHHPSPRGRDGPLQEPVARPFQHQRRQHAGEHRAGVDVDAVAADVGRPHRRMAVDDDDAVIARVEEEFVADPDAQPENFFGKVEVAGHAELGEAYIGPVEICDQIEQDDQRQDAPGYFATERRNIFGAERCTRAGGRLRFV